MPKKIDIEARKEQMANAVWQTIVEDGVAAVSVRRVADRAGVAVGSLRHVFPTRSELVEFSARLMVDAAAERARAVPRCDEPEEYAIRVLREFLPLDAQRRAELEVNLALIAEAPVLPELTRIRNEATRALRAACVMQVELLRGRTVDFGSALEGAGDQRAGARLHALIDGLALHLLMDEGLADEALGILREELSRISRNR